MATTKEQDRNLRDAAEELFGYSPCLHCRNFIKDVYAEGVHCRAFTDIDIPEEIFFGRNLHKDPYPGDHGIQFDPED
ncbi:MAG: hypothetical protein A4E45_00649 [Methanosaeta sp. PtaB.Bin039]|nr:MAG: hypothetical protein A4E45_00649 [Methanosaeta sp. PtaB.Bin039]HQF16016.1 hypothetical protein [Methanotrichaceae archaeon]HQI90636.1 hypothetical protein [Methanotrichaceae archaeon]HQJ28083.1 hypothetical protein [Methanotrichaceae archaeon]